MGAFFECEEIKVRPGIYKNYDTPKADTTAQAIDGVGAIPISADFGPLDEVVEFSGNNISESLEVVYGTGGTVGVAQSFAKGGLSTLYVYRMGNGGNCAEVTLNNAVKITALYPGKRNVSVSVKKNLSDENTMTFTAYEKTNIVIESFNAIYDSETGAAAALADAINNKSVYFKAQAVSGGGDDVFVENAALSGGENPAVTAKNYSDAFSALEPYNNNVITLDTIKPLGGSDASVDIQKLLFEYVKEAYKGGKNLVGVIGYDTDTDIKERINKAKEFDSELVITTGSTFADSNGIEIKGAEAVARQAGVIAATPSNESILHTAIPGAAACSEKFTNDIYESAINAGLLLISEGSGGEVWFDSSINSLKTLSEKQDAGWKKIKRTRVRMELFDRIDRNLEPVVGKINCDKDGISVVIQKATDVIEAMISENKLAVGSEFKLDADKGYGADYAYFSVTVYDVDTLEKIYLTYHFHYKSA